MGTVKRGLLKGDCPQVTGRLIHYDLFKANEKLEVDRFALVLNKTKIEDLKNRLYQSRQNITASLVAISQYVAFPTFLTMKISWPENLAIGCMFPLRVPSPFNSL